MAGRDWREWHRQYDDETSPVQERLRCVQDHLATALAAAPPGPITVLSICGGEGRDVIPVVATHPRRADVQATIVEVDPVIAAAARDQADRLGLHNVRTVVADAGLADTYRDCRPADVLLVCGVFGNIADEDIERTIGYLPCLVGPGATVIWTRHHKPPDATPRIRRLFAAARFAEVAFTAPERWTWSVGVHRFRGPPRRREAGSRLFAFVDRDAAI